MVYRLKKINNMSCTQCNFPMIIPFTNSDMIANGVHNSSTPRNERKKTVYIIKAFHVN